MVKRLIALEGDWLMLPGETETITVPKASFSLPALATQPANSCIACVAVANVHGEPFMQGTDTCAHGQ